MSTDSPTPEIKTYPFKGKVTEGTITVSEENGISIIFNPTEME
jgi:hypothetical protein